MIAREIRSKSHSVSLGSFRRRDAKRPISCRKEKVRGPRTPEVSTATGQKRNLGSKEAYFEDLASSAAKAADPGAVAERKRFPLEKVSVQVASQSRALPF